MNTILDNLKTNFATEPILANVFEGDHYTLQPSCIVKINGEDKSIPITWNETVANTSAAGTFSYTGVNKEFNREFTTNLTVSPNVFDEEYCYVKNIYKVNGKTYNDADLVEFYMNSEALSEAIKDNYAPTDENGRKFLPDPYYIRNNYSTIKTYEVSNDSTFYLLSYILNIPTTNSTEVTEVPYNKFEEYIKSHPDMPTNKNPRSLLCKIKLKNNVIYDISSVFTP